MEGRSASLSAAAVLLEKVGAGSDVASGVAMNDVRFLGVPLV